MGTGFGVGQGVVMVFHVETTCRRNGLKLMIGQPSAKSAARRPKGIVENVFFRVFHLINGMGCPKTTLVKTRIVSHKRKSSHQGAEAVPYLFEIRGVDSIFQRQAVNAGTPITIIFWLGANQGIGGVDNAVVTHHDNAHTTNAAGHLIGRFKVDGCEIHETVPKRRCYLFVGAALRVSKNIPGVWKSGCFMYFFFMEYQTTLFSGVKSARNTPI